MASFPQYVYLISFDSLGIIFIGSSKQKVYDFFTENHKFNLTGIDSYNRFSRYLKKNGRSTFYTRSGIVNADYMPINLSMISPGSLFSQE